MAKTFTYASPYSIGDRVLIGDDETVIASVTAICWRVEVPQIEVSWMNQGNLNTVWVSPAQLTAAPDHLARRRPLKVA